MKMRAKILLIAIVPLLLLGTITAMVSNQRTTKVVTESIENGLRGTAVSVRDNFDHMNQEPYYVAENGELYKGDVNITQSTEIADHLKKSANMDITIFYGDTRYMTSVKDEKGERVIGTQAGSRAIDQVLEKGEEFFATDADVAGQK